MATEDQTGAADDAAIEDRVDTTESEAKGGSANVLAMVLIPLVVIAAIAFLANEFFAQPADPLDGKPPIEEHSAGPS